METKKLFWAVPVSSAFFLSLASPALGVWPCITVALVPLFYFVSNPTFSIKRKVGVAYLTVFLFLLWQYQFFWHLLPLNWIGITNKMLSLCIVGILWIILSAINALSGILLVLPFTRFFVSRFSSLFFIFLWPVSEVFRSFIYSLLVAGTGAGIGDHFQFGFLAYVFSSSNFFRSLAPILGVFGLSLIPALLAVLFL
jgi:apolipoprotein N-acyltransferase